MNNLAVHWIFLASTNEPIGWIQIAIQTRCWYMTLVKLLIQRVRLASMSTHNTSASTALLSWVMYKYWVLTYVLDNVFSLNPLTGSTLSTHGSTHTPFRRKTKYIKKMRRDQSDAVRWFSTCKLFINFPNFRYPPMIATNYSRLLSSLYCSLKHNELRVQKT
jgi:hypothetical protein